jgi:hypothetical protein
MYNCSTKQNDTVLPCPLNIILSGACHATMEHMKHCRNGSAVNAASNIWQKWMSHWSQHMYYD